MSRIRAALLREPGQELEIEEVDLGDLEPDEIRVRVHSSGVCHTDLSGIAGVVPLPYPAVLGHEGAGTVVEVGDAVVDLAVGDRVAVSFASCGECEPCMSAHPAYCEIFAALNYFGTRLDGSTTMCQGELEVHGNFFGQSSFATELITAARNAVALPDDFPLELAGPLGCGLLTGAGTVRNVLQLTERDSVAVFGIGTVGLASVMAAAVAGCRTIIAVDLSADRLELARELGATHVVDASVSDDVVWDVMAVEPAGVDAAIDAVGLEVVIQQGLECLAVRGTLATLGLQGLENPVTVNQGHILLGRTITGVIEGDAQPRELIPVMIDWWRQGRFPIERLVEVFPFDALQEALAATASGRVIKPVVEMP
ncbi:MAG: NAD(P)-dependent alcohol dehydrogenase [Actinobacteria bacterium]|nr:NAD(P)-dependent alcohol dehydrogenase [Actinomycetota bacterium]